VQGGSAASASNGPGHSLGWMWRRQRPHVLPASHWQEAAAGGAEGGAGGGGGGAGVGRRGGGVGGMSQPCISYTSWNLPQLVAPLSVPQSPSPSHSVPGAAPRNALVQGGSAASASNGPGHSLGWMWRRQRPHVLPASHWQEAAAGGGGGGGRSEEAERGAACWQTKGLSSLTCESSHKPAKACPGGYRYAASVASCSWPLGSPGAQFL